MADVLAAVQRLSDERLKSKCEMAIDIIDRSIAMYGCVAQRVAYAMRCCAHRGWVGGWGSAVFERCGGRFVLYAL